MGERNDYDLLNTEFTEKEYAFENI